MTYLFLLLAFPAMALAYTPSSQQECSSLDLRNSFIYEIRNQKEVAWCYAFTGADMLAYTYQSSEKISAADMAIGYNETKLGKLIRWFDVNVMNRSDHVRKLRAHQMGLNKFSLKNALKDGTCPERVFPSEAWVKMTRTETGWTESSVPLDQAMIDIALLHSKRKKLTTETLPYYYSFKNVGADNFVQLLQTKNVARFYSSLRQVVCKDDRQPYDTKWKVKMTLKNRSIFRTISEQLEQGRLVGIDYDNRVLEDNTHAGVSLAKLHTSSLIGRRWNHEKNSCEFLIRDSYGNQCEKYDPSYGCEGGNVWISESKIYSNIVSAVYMLSEH